MLYHLSDQGLTGTERRRNVYVHLKEQMCSLKMKHYIHVITITRDSIVKGHAVLSTERGLYLAIVRTRDRVLDRDARVSLKLCTEYRREADDIQFPS